MRSFILKIYFKISFFVAISTKYFQLKHRQKKVRVDFKINLCIFYGSVKNHNSRMNTLLCWILGKIGEEGRGEGILSII